MDIKSKRYNQSKAWSIVAFILCVVFFVGTLTTGAMALKSASGLNGSGTDVDDVLFYPSYVESETFQQEFTWKTYDVLHLIVDLKGKEYIESGQALSQRQLEDRIRDLFYDKASYDESLFEKYGDYYYDNNAAGLQRFEADYAEEIHQIRKELIADQLRDFERSKAELDKIEGFKYYATDGTNLVTNLEDTADGFQGAVDPSNAAGNLSNAGEDLASPTQGPVLGNDLLATMKGSFFIDTVDKGEYLIYENGKLTKTSPSAESANQHIRDNDRYLEEHLYNQYNRDLKVFLAFEESYLAGKEEAFQESKAEMFKWVPILAISALLTIAALICLIVLTGRKNPEGNRPSYRMDRIFTEIQLLIIAGCFFGGGGLFIQILFHSIQYSPYYYGGISSANAGMLIQMGGAVLVGLLSASVGLLFILSCVRNLKAERFLKNFLTYKLLASIFGGIRDLYHGGGVMRKVVLITLAVCILSATVVLAPVVGILILVLAPKWVKKYEEIRKGVGEVRNGNLTYKIPVSGEGELDRLALEINDISAASNIAIQNELKNQRLKTDLISNVSHDLKTPLTSIITYIDLLKTEGLDSENAPQYLEVLEQKSMRLQKLTEDLFDAAKASSGAIPVKIETVDMLSLINQGLGEMAARIEDSGLDFIVKANEERYYVRADGQLLWRVVENLLGNVLKYALQGSRVYIDLKEVGGVNGGDVQVLLEIKNISKTELNINADELMERFKRGDESRTTEGSGLGLAIAKDLVILQNGWFEIKIDGDLFKAIVMLPRA